MALLRLMLQMSNQSQWHHDTYLLSSLSRDLNSIPFLSHCTKNLRSKIFPWATDIWNLTFQDFNNICCLKEAWVVQLVQHLPLACIMISGSWDRALHGAPCSVGGSVSPSPSAPPPPICARALSLKLINKCNLKKKNICCLNTFLCAKYCVVTYILSFNHYYIKEGLWLLVV